ncbi:MAG: SDR family NAD(P)-dependent oxidoreductase [Gammaproteobacteria bacterium]|jgi:short-subunit dehydrogenase
MQSILITGASSGIGASLAESYAKEGVFLALTGRNMARLEDVAERCRKLGAEVIVSGIDVRDKEKLCDWIFACDKIRKLDLVIANAGISNAGRETKEEFDREIFAINFDGALNTVYPALKLMRERKCGQIAIISSLAAFHGFPRSPAYSASKAAVKTFGEALRNRVKKDNVKINVVCPGFVRTPLTDKNPYFMPFIMSPEKAAKIIQHGLEKNKGLIAFPKRFYFVIWVLRLFPARIIEFITSFV